MGSKPAWAVRSTPLVAAVLCLSCGGEVDSESVNICSPFTACGGDAVGTWEIQSVCIEQETLHPTETCPDATVTYTSLDASGTVEIGALGTYHQVETDSAAARVVMPLSCLSGASCNDYASAAEQSAREGGDTAKVTCSMKDESCICTIQVTDSVDEEGTYTTSVTTLIAVQPDGTEHADPYCVSGNELHIDDGNVDYVFVRR